MGNPQQLFKSALLWAKPPRAARYVGPQERKQRFFEKKRAKNCLLIWDWGV
jgi:hypothetical protein